MELGFHIADFTWSHPVAELGPTLGRVAVAAEAAGRCGAEPASYQGQHYQLGRTLNVPLPLSGREPFLMVGGSGEQKTLRLVAQYATACNLFFRPDSAHKLDVLRAHCDTVGRDYEHIEKTTTIALDASADRSQLLSLLSQAHDTGFTTAYLYARNPSPLAVVDLLAEVIPEISRW